MKKIISLVLMIAILLSCSAFAEEFTFHNRTKFGMTKEEVLAIENEFGLTFSLPLLDFFADSEKEVVRCNSIAEYGTIAAGIPNSTIGYCFDDNGKMCMGRYDFGIADINAFTTIENSLTKKYGETEFTSKSQMEMNPHIFFYNNWPFTIKLEFTAANLAWYAFGPTPYVLEEYSQRLILNEDGSGIYIEHGLYSAYYDTLKETDYTHILNYKFVDADTINYLTFAEDKATDDL